MSSPLLTPKAAYATPIAQRGHKGYLWLLKALLFGLLFDAGLLTINATQFLLLPLRLVPAFRTAYERGIQYTKGAFGTLVGEYARSERRVLSETEHAARTRLGDVYLKQQSSCVSGLHPQSSS